MGGWQEPDPASAKSKQVSHLRVSWLTCCMSWTAPWWRGRTRPVTGLPHFSLLISRSGSS